MQDWNIEELESRLRNANEIICREQLRAARAESERDQMIEELAELRAAILEFQNQMFEKYGE